MTSQERRRVRYIRRVARRRERMLNAKPGPDNCERKIRRTGGAFKPDPRKRKKQPKWKSRVADADCFENVFSFGHLWRSYKICRRNVRWKGSVQRYMLRAPMELSNVFHRLHAGKYRTMKYHEFDTCERGKKRHISAQHIRDRVVHRCACDYALVPRLGRSFVYDNGASMEQKGQHFAMNRCVAHLHQFYREWGNDGYILTFDFSKFFDTVDHRNVMNIIRKNFRDPKIIKFMEIFCGAMVPLVLVLVVP